MRLGTSWVLREPYGEPPFATRFEDNDGVVGRHFFEQWARRNHARLTPAPEGAGILASFDELASDDFDPAKVHPLVRALYERTTAIDFDADEPGWTFLGWAWNFAYNRLVARSMGQLVAPVEPSYLPSNVSTVDLIDVNESGVTDYRAWVRIYARANKIFYTAAMFSCGSPGARGTQRYLVAVLPLVRRSLTIVFHPVNLPNGGFALRTRQPGSYLAGMYFVFPSKNHFSMTPVLGMHEQVHMRPGRDARGEYLEGKHETNWGLIPGYTIPYRLRLKDQVR